MAAPDGIKWGNTSNDYVRLGIYVKPTSSATQTKLTVEVWIWSKYSLYDGNNTLYFSDLATSGSATTSYGSKTIDTTVDTGAGWSTTNQQKLGTYNSGLYTRSKSDATRYLYAKLANVYNHSTEVTLTVSTTAKIPKLASYAVTYNANGGTGAPSAQTKWYGETLKLSSSKPTRTGYTFKGWATSASGNAAYSAGDNYTANAAVTLYAVWQAITYTVSYNANGGSGAPTAQTKTYGKTLTLSAVKPTRANYNFKGWATSESGSVAYSAGGSYTANAGATLYAVWELAYTKPRIKSLVIERVAPVTNEQGTIIGFKYNDEGTYLHISFDWETDKAFTEAVAEWKTTDAASYANVDKKTVTEANTNSPSDFNEIVGDGKIKSDASYTVRVTVRDELGSTTLEKAVKQSSLIAYKAHPPEDADGGVFEILYEAKCRNGLTVDGAINTNSPAETRGNLKTWCFDNTTNPSYAGLARPDGTTAGWTRVTQTGLLPYEQGGNSSSLGSASWPFKNGYFKNLYADGNDILNGSSWQTATLTSNFVKYDGKDDNMPQYKKIGKLVEVRGAVSPASTITGSADAYTIFTLPEGYRPSKQVSILSPGSGSNQWLLTITATGLVRFARYNNGAGYVNATTTTWLPFHAMYFVD